jgi:hypothetical protein
MALIPLRQTVIVHKPLIKDKYGEVISTQAPIPVKARVDDVIERVVNQLGAEVSSSMTVYLDKLPNISYQDEIEYTNELGVTAKKKPIRIEPLRMLNGKATLTLVYC